MDGQLVLGRQITVVFAEENRKKPQEMRVRDRVRFVGSSQSDYLAAEWPTLSLFIVCCTYNFQKKIVCCTLQRSFL